MPSKKSKDTKQDPNMRTKAQVKAKRMESIDWNGLPSKIETLEAHYGPALTELIRMFFDKFSEERAGELKSSGSRLSLGSCPPELYDSYSMELDKQRQSLLDSLFTNICLQHHCDNYCEQPDVYTENDSDKK